MLERNFSIDINAPAERVWQEITRGGGPIHPMFGTYLHGEWKVGQVFSHRTKDGKHTFVMGEVLEVVPVRRLVHTFRFTFKEDPPTLVVWELKEMEGKTRVTITHSRFTGETSTYKAISGGWPRILALYKAEIERGNAPLGPRLMNAIMGMTAFMMPKGAKTKVAMAGATKLPE